MPQASEYIPPLSIFEFLSSCADQKCGYGVSISAIEISMLLTKLGLCGLEHKSLTVLSGGEFRRVLFGAALLGDPKLLLLDEPLVSLDKAARSTMIDVISSKLQEDPPATAIIVSHDEAFLLEFCTRVFQVAHCGLRDLLASNEESEEEIEEDPPKDWIQ